MSRIETRIRPLWERICAERPDYAGAFDFSDPKDLMEAWFLLNWHGVEPEHSEYHQEVRVALWPIPPHALIARVVGEMSDEAAFRQGGLVDWRRFWLCLEASGQDFGAPARVLDFGVGCGRILRYFALYAEHWELHGADVDPDAIAWDRAELDFGHFQVLEPDGRAPFEDASFDILYAFSVLTHLPEDRHRHWLEEMRRIVKPGARLVLTTMGETAIERIVAGRHPAPHPEPEVLAEAVPRLRSEGFVFFPYDMERAYWQDEGNRRYFREIPAGSYGTTFILESYIRREWSSLFEVESVLEGPDEWQDYVTLRRR